MYSGDISALHALHASTQANPFNFQLLQQALHDGVAEEQYPIGCQLDDLFDRKPNPMRIVNYQKVQLPNGTYKMAAILLRMFAIQKRTVFDDWIFADAVRERGRYYQGRYDFSIVHQWLNYTGDDKNWYHPHFACKNAHPEYYTAHCPYGYLHYCSSTLRKAISPIVITTPVFDERGKRLRDDSKTIDLAFLPSCEEMGIDIDNHINLEQTAWRWFLQNAEDCFESPDDKQTQTLCWTRSAIPIFLDSPFSSVHIQTVIYTVNYMHKITKCQPDVRLFTLPAHAIIG